MRRITFVSLTVGQWESKETNLVNHTLYGLTKDGTVYRYSPSKNPAESGWKLLNPYMMEESNECPFGCGYVRKGTQR